MYFALSAVLKKFRYLKFCLAVLLAVVGAKMLLKNYLEAVPGKTYLMLGAIVLIMGAGVLASVVWPGGEGGSGTGNREPGTGNQERGTRK